MHVFKLGRSSSVIARTHTYQASHLFCAFTPEGYSLSLSLALISSGDLYGQAFDDLIDPQIMFRAQQNAFDDVVGEQ